MNLKHLTLILVSAVIASCPLQAAETPYKTISHINEILEEVPLIGPTIAILDWDKTISLEEGQHEYRESGPNGTLATIQALQKKGVQTIILTSRKSLVPATKVSHGNDISMAETSVRRLLPQLGDRWTSHGALKVNTLQRIYPQSESGEVSTSPLIAFKQIVYTGGTTPKGVAAANLIDQGKFKEKPANVIFVDDEEYNIKNFAEVFKDRSENVLIYHYPKL